MFEYWKTRNGLYIKLVDLEDDHLINIVALLKRTGLEDEYPEIYNECKSRKLKLPN